MSGASFRVSIFGDSRAEQQMAALVAAGEDLSEFNDALGLVLESNTIDRFDREVDVDGSPLTPSIRAKVEGGKTLTDSGRYKGSITYESNASEIRVGTNVLYAAPNHFGATIRAKGGGKLTFRLPGGLGFRSVEEVVLPARPVIGFGAEDRSDAAALFEDFFAVKAPDLFAGGSA
ncbi:phage virion morphogenesis protein [Sphingopyxis granuli]|uniref:phage virion morphogenesis protein n=1 Tax=Sphingopyxis granuli TaxID=267128 RepID=UPI001BAE7C42|nr:phage virion morphogenesis protein [Sphingopyxis granuli]QUM72185.1 phage virion morphogenesis protein [Sphingopyxis granuli]